MEAPYGLVGRKRPVECMDMAGMPQPPSMCELRGTEIEKPKEIDSCYPQPGKCMSLCVLYRGVFTLFMDVCCRMESCGMIGLCDNGQAPSHLTIGCLASGANAVRVALPGVRSGKLQCLCRGVWTCCVSGWVGMDTEIEAWVDLID